MSPPASSEPLTRLGTLIQLFALSGDFPIDLLDKLNGSRVHTRNTVDTLIKHKLIRRYKKDGIKSLRLTKKCRNKLMKGNEERFTKLLEGAGLIRSQKSDLVVRQRTHRMAAANLLMLEAGVYLHRDEKARIFEVLPDQITPEEAEEIMSEWATPCYYSSVEIKHLDLSSRRIKGTRALGLLLPENPRPYQQSHPYLLYYMNKTLGEWAKDLETQLSSSMFTALNIWGRHYGTSYAIMIGDDMDTFRNLMMIPGKRKNVFTTMADHSSFEHFHFIPMDDSGKLLFRYLCNIDAKHAFEECIRLEYDDIPEKYRSFFYHAYHSQSDRYVFFGWDMDMQQLANFKNGLVEHKKTGLILCFDFQADAYRELFGDLVDIRLLEINLIRKELLNGA